MAKIHYASNGKRDLHGLEKEFDISFDRLQGENWIYDSNRQVVIDYIRDCKKGKAKSGGTNKRVGKSTLYRIVGILRLLSENWVKKDFNKTTQKDWDKFYDDMEDDKIFNDYGKKFKPSTKAKLYKTIRKFLKWKFGENKYVPAFCGDWVTTEEQTTKEYLTRAEIEKIVNATSTLKVKCLIMMLFDGGFRIEELANLRWTDVKKTDDKEYYRAYLRPETTKTKKERYVSLWLSTDLIDSYKNSEKNRLGKDFKESDFMFKSSYHPLYTTIRKIGKKVLNKKISPHTMRHSSATYYASVIKTYQQFCLRYGWALRSSSPQRYFHKVEDDEIADQTKDHEIARFKTEFERSKLENKQMREQITGTEKKLEDINSFLKELIQLKGKRELNNLIIELKNTK